VCQVAFLQRRRKYPGAAPPNPKLPQLQHISRERIAI
jgi:hypothetical protein